MTRGWRRLGGPAIRAAAVVLERGFPCAACAAVWIAASAGSASAQAVFVTRAPAGASFELLYTGTAVGPAVVDGQGMASLVVPSGGAGKRDIDAAVYVDTCRERVKVVVVESGREAPAPDAGCTRQPIPGIFWVQPISTVVVDLGTPGPTLLLRQGRFTPPPPSSDVEEGSSGPGRTWTPVATGVVLSAGGGFSWLSNMEALACGTVADCVTDDGWFAYGAGVALWLNRYMAVEVNYLRPSDAKTEGRGTGYRFDSTFEAHVFSFGAKAGAVAGPVRIYGRGGANYQRSTLSTNQTVDDRTVTIDGVETVVEGGTQALGLRTSGWAWYAGGGAEIWMTRWLAAYGEVERAVLKGEDRDDGEALLEDTLMGVFFGIRVRIGG